MAEGQRKILVCSCEDTMPLDADGVRRACRGAEVIAGRHLCRSELARVQNALAGEEAITIACTQEAPLFRELAGAEGAARVSFVNIRETAGWSKDAERRRAEDGGADRRKRWRRRRSRLMSASPAAARR